MSEIIALYTDGGLIGGNPSTIGGTWAFCGVDKDGNRVLEQSGVVECPEGKTITNNHMEQIAIVKALEAMPDGWNGTVCSDSNVAIGRVFRGWKRTNLPANIAIRASQAVIRLGQIKTVLLQGHPTKKDLECGIGAKRNLPVSIHNVWCDKACKQAGDEYKEKISAAAAEMPIADRIAA